MEDVCLWKLTNQFCNLHGNRIKNCQDHSEKSKVKVILSNSKTYYVATVNKTASGLGERIDKWSTGKD